MKRAPSLSIKIHHGGARQRIFFMIIVNSTVDYAYDQPASVDVIEEVSESITRRISSYWRRVFFTSSENNDAFIRNETNKEIPPPCPRRRGWVRLLVLHRLSQRNVSAYQPVVDQHRVRNDHRGNVPAWKKKDPRRLNHREISRPRVSIIRSRDIR